MAAAFCSFLIDCRVGKMAAKLYWLESLSLIEGSI